MYLWRSFTDLLAPADTKNITCANPLSNLVGEPIVGGITFHRLMVYVSAACLVLTALSAWLSTWRHLRSYTSPHEQRQILRIVHLPPV